MWTSWDFFFFVFENTFMFFWRVPNSFRDHFINVRRNRKLNPNSHSHNSNSVFHSRSQMKCDHRNLEKLSSSLPDEEIIRKQQQQQKVTHCAQWICVMFALQSFEHRAQSIARTTQNQPKIGSHINLTWKETYIRKVNKSRRTIGFGLRARGHQMTKLPAAVATHALPYMCVALLVI